MKGNLPSTEANGYKRKGDYGIPGKFMAAMLPKGCVFLFSAPSAEKKNEQELCVLCVSNESRTAGRVGGS